MHRRCFLLAGNLLALLTRCSRTAGKGSTDKGSSEPAPPKLGVELRAVTPSVAKNTIPEFAADLVNQGREPVTVLLPRDGSDCGWSTPVVRWRPAIWEMPRCGYVSGLTRQEFMTLMPGERVKLNWIIGPFLTQEGKHEISLEVEHVPGIEWRGVPCPPHDPEAMKAVRESAPWKAVSNTVEVTVH